MFLLLLLFWGLVMKLKKLLFLLFILCTFNLNCMEDLDLMEGCETCVAKILIKKHKDSFPYPEYFLPKLLEKMLLISDASDYIYIIKMLGDKNDPNSLYRKFLSFMWDTQFGISSKEWVKDKTIEESTGLINFYTLLKKLEPDHVPVGYYNLAKELEYPIDFANCYNQLQKLKSE